MCTTGDILNDTQQKAFEDWMKNKNGAFAGVHSATDTEPAWPFYQEVVGQNYNGHGDDSNALDQVEFDAAALDFPAVKGIANPWQRNDEWYRFDSWKIWSAKPGFKILGRKKADGQPITWVREYSNFRSFYTGLGHSAAPYSDAAYKKHVTGGLMWAVRREGLIR